MQIRGRTFIISGGSSGLGLATAILLLRHGANVAIFDVNPPPEQHAAELDASRVLFTKTNVSSTESLQNALRSTLQWIKSSTAKPLAGTICCAGIGGAALALPRQDPSASHDHVKYMDISSFDRVLSVNLRGTVDLIRLTLPHMALNTPYGPDGERGVVIVVSSVAAYEGQVGQLAYSASKGAVRSIVLPLARELGRGAGIRVVGIAPGVFETGMTKPKPHPKPRSEVKKGGDTSSRAMINPEMVQYPKRMGRGDEFARLVKEIVENPMINGDTIRLDGAVRMPSRL